MMALMIIVAVLGFIIWLLCGGLTHRPPEPSRRDLRIGRNQDGTFYIYDNDTNDVLGTFESEDIAKEHLDSLKS